MASDLPIARRVIPPLPVGVVVSGPARLPLARRARCDISRGLQVHSRCIKQMPSPSPTGFLVTLGFYGAMLWTMIAYMLAVGIYLDLRYENYDTIPRHVFQDRAVTDAVALSALHSLLVVGAVVASWRPPRNMTPAKPLITWAVALPLLAIMLVVNFGYGLALRLFVETVTGVRVADDSIAELGFGDGWVAVLLICVHPAIIEEVFFRFLLLGHFRPHIGLHGAVWLSSFFFAAAHLGQLIAFPVLFLLGGILAYARVYSGGLTLPILIHFLHNLAVLYLGPILDKIHFV
jgi:membrane protease YdiL (CAAX protease family)